MSELTVICCSCGDLFCPDSDHHNTLSLGSPPDDEFYVCDECLQSLNEGDDHLAADSA